MGLIDYSDFKGLNYREKTHKISKIRELVDRLFADTDYKMERLNNINLGIKNIKTRIDDTVIEEPTPIPPIPPIPPEPTDCYIIVHGHNPEDKEINTITGVGNTVTVYNDGNNIGYAGHTPIIILSGHHIIEVKFNGIILEQEVDIDGGATRIFYFVFNRIESSFANFVVSKMATLPCPGFTIVPYTIPAQDFYLWYCQDIGSVGTTDVTITGVGPPPIVFSSSAGGIEYHISKISAIVSYSSFNFYLANIRPLFTWISMYSVPYDMDGLAI